MKKYLLQLFAASLLLLISCKKDKDIISPQPGPVVIADTAKVLIKEIIQNGLPNPFFRFEYSREKYTSKLNYASGFELYEFTYENKRLKKVINTQNNNQLLYNYQNNQVSLITEISGTTNRKIRSYAMQYTGAARLTQVNGYIFPENSLDSILDSKLLLTYHTDGNLASLENYLADGNNQLQFSRRKNYSQYDQQKNADGITLLKEFTGILLFLPSVTLQLNNPKLELITSAFNDFRITYTYDYNNQLPIRRNGVMTQTRGNGTGQSILVNTQFTYY